MKNEKTLVQACIEAENVQGGTIHQFLPHLKWFYLGFDCGNPFYILCLQTERTKKNHYPKNSKYYGKIGSTHVHSKSDLPEITPSLRYPEIQFIGV